MVADAEDKPTLARACDCHAALGGVLDEGPGYWPGTASAYWDLEEGRSSHWWAVPKVREWQSLAGAGRCNWGLRSAAAPR